MCCILLICITPYLHHLKGTENYPNVTIVLVLVFNGNVAATYHLEEEKLDGVGPVDNRPATDKLHPFVKKEEEKRNVTCDM